MGYKPQFNFKLRDDEIIFGNLIIGKEIIPDIEKLLLAIRQGVQLNTSAYSTLFNSYIFTDSEFQSVKEDYEQVKIDYDFFKDTLRNMLRFDFSSSLRHTTIMTNYIVGSSTWLEKYIEMKNIAGEMFRKLKSLGYDFEGREFEYETRYKDIKEEEVSNGAITDTLTEQYKEDILNHVPDANDRYLKAMSSLGPIEQAKAENIIKLQNVAIMAGSGALATTVPVGQADSNIIITAETKQEQVQEDVLIHITVDELKNKLNTISMQKDIVKVVTGFCILNAYIELLCRDAHVAFPKTFSDYVKKAYDLNLTLDKVREYESYIINTISYSSNAGLLNAEGYMMKKSEWEIYGFASGSIGELTSNVKPLEDSSNITIPNITNVNVADKISQVCESLSRLQPEIRLKKYIELADWVIGKIRHIPDSELVIKPYLNSLNRETIDISKYLSSQSFIVEVLEKDYLSRVGLTKEDLKYLNDIVFI